MDLKETLQDIENIVSQDTQKNLEEENNSSTKSKSVSDVVYLITSFFLDVLKTPFKIVARYIKNDLVTMIRKDLKLYALVMGIMGVLFVFFSVLWLFVSVAVGVYFYQKGESLLLSVIYSISFQLISFVVIALIAFITTTRIKSLKLIKDFKN